MKGKLVKEYEDFYLISDKEIQKGDEYVKLNNRPRTLLLGTTISHVTKVSKLSFKNCESIECGYDLDELAMGYDLYENINFVGQMRAYKAGFQTALEILSNKKFTEEDMINFSEFVSGKYINQHKFLRDKSLKGFFITAEILKEYQSLQQTEWQVEVVMDRIPADLAPGGWDVFPKLDAQGCLILKRVE